MKKLIIATRNKSKVVQIKEILKGLPFEILSLDESGITEEIIEDGKTLEQNAVRKAMFAYSRSGEIAIADDTGFSIEALGGLPGMHAARWGGNLTTDERMWYTLKRLENVVEEGRIATFTTVAALVLPTGEALSFYGSVRGTILTAPRTACQPNMPYSAVFVPNGQEKTWAEMTTEEENAISHRGIAFKKLRDYLSELSQ